MSIVARCGTVVVSLTAAISPASLPAQGSLPGWSLTTNIVIDSGQGAAKRSSIAMKQQVTARRIRQSFVQVSGALTEAEGMYMVYDTADSTVTTVMPAQQVATVSSSNFAAMGALLPKVERHVTKNVVDDLGPGEPMLGRPTHRFRVTQAGTVETTLMGESCVQPFDDVSEMWIAPSLDLERASEAMAKTLLSATGLGGDVPNRTGSSTESKLPKGSPLRTIHRSTHMDEQGKPFTVTMTMDIVELIEGPIDDVVFAVPDGYRTMDMRKMMNDLPPGMLDSAMKAGAGAHARAMGGCQR